MTARGEVTDRIVGLELGAPPDTLRAHEIAQELSNVYGRENIISYRHDLDDSGRISREACVGFSIIPILGVSARL